MSTSKSKPLKLFVKLIFKKYSCNCDLHHIHISNLFCLNIKGYFYSGSNTAGSVLSVKETLFKSEHSNRSVKLLGY